MTLASRAILVVEDEPQIRRVLRTLLELERFRIIEADSAARGLTEARTHKPDLVIIDLGLPDRDGMEVITGIRSWSRVPIIVLSARSDESDKVAALEAGADDYVTKPFGIAELMARLRTALRHRLQQDGAVPVHRSFDLTVDLVRRIVTVAGQPVHLSPREYDILALMVKHAGRVLTHRQILGQLWGPGGDVQQLRVYVRQLRQKIETDPERPHHILTETGVGYRLAVEE